MNIEERGAAEVGRLVHLAYGRGGLDTYPEFLEKLPLAVYACDRDGRILWFNARAANLWGRAPRIGDDSEKYCGSHKLYFDGRQISRDETPMAAVLRTGKSIRGVEARVERPDGSCIWAMVHIEPIEDEDGHLVGAVNCFHETTALHHAPDELDDFFENAPVGMHLVSPIGTILRANRAELQMLGYELNEYVGRNIAEFHVDAATIEDFLSRLNCGEQLIARRARLWAKDGSIREVRVTSNARRRNGELINTRCITIDVTEQTRAQELLDQQGQRLVATYEHAGIGIAEADIEGKLTRVNSHLAELLGYSREELLGRSIFDPALTEEAEADQAQYRLQVLGQIDRYTVEKRFCRRDGSKLWINITSSSIRDGHGRFLFAVRTQQDITARKDAEFALARRAREQTALYDFVESLQSTVSINDVYVRALDAIEEALECDRASILLFDASGILKFVGWRGLSESYRAAVEGHSPWQRDTKHPRLICVDNIDFADLPDNLKEVVRAEGIRALTFIPIMARGQLLGKFMTYYDRPHTFVQHETDLALTLAHQLGLAIERARAEEARQSTERAAQQLVAIVESSHDAIVSKNLDGIITTWNQGAERLFGYTAEEVIGKSITILIPPDRLHEEPSILARIRRGERVDHFETLRRRKDGSLVNISLTISPVRNSYGRIVGASKIARDITERKEAEAKLQDSERQLKELLGAIPAAIYTTDAEGKITYFNQEAVKLAGRTPVLGTDEWCVTWKLYWPDGTPLPHDQCPMAVALKEGRPIRNAEAIAERPDGTRVPFIPYPTPLRDSKGNVVGAINMLVDVSERKEAETQQRVLFNELNHRVKNNMQMLQSLLYMAGRQTKSAEAKKVLDEASGRITAMAAAQQVLYGTRDSTRFNTQEFLDAVCRTIQQTVPKNLKIVCEAVEAQLANDSAMPLALILNELLTNAVKHGSSRTTASSVRVSLTRQEPSFALCVEDDGPGFDLDAVRDRASGLQLVQALARQLGGKFEVACDPVTRCSIYFS
jgi:PAS domain S-box-containing protein